MALDKSLALSELPLPPLAGGWLNHLNLPGLCKNLINSVPNTQVFLSAQLTAGLQETRPTCMGLKRAYALGQI